MVLQLKANRFDLASGEDLDEYAYIFGFERFPAPRVHWLRRAYDSFRKVLALKPTVRYEPETDEELRARMLRYLVAGETHTDPNGDK